MGSTTFTTWAALHSAMLDALADAIASGGFHGINYTYNGRSREYRTMAELKAGIEWAKQMADTETSISVPRTYAKNGGGGRW